MTISKSPSDPTSRRTGHALAKPARGNVLLGCIADDFTGATDLAGVLAKEGMRVVQTIGVPRTFRPAACDAIVVALKTRTCPANEAVTQSIEALNWLRATGATQYSA